MLHRRGIFGLLALSGFAHAQDPLTAFPHNYGVAFQNEVVTVIRVHYGPHEKIGVHDHSKAPTVYVYLNDAGPVRFQHFEEPSFTLTRPPTFAGAFRVSPGRIEEHTVENTGASASEFLRVELTKIPLGSMKSAFRGPAPKSLAESRTAIEFQVRGLEVVRVICTTTCQVVPSTSPSLLVAFSAGRVGSKELFHSGGLRWLAPNEAVEVASEGSAPAHLLRILIPPLVR
jgi:hypothetical protein